MQSSMDYYRVRQRLEKKCLQTLANLLLLLFNTDNDSHFQLVIATYLSTSTDTADLIIHSMEARMTQTAEPRPEPAAPLMVCPPRKRITTDDLMQGAQAIIVLHQGEEYQLRITKRGKLILTK